MKQIFVITFLVIAIVSCSPKKKEEASSPVPEIETIGINPEKAQGVTASELFESIDYIPLPSDDQHLVYEIRKIREVGDSLVVMTDQGLWLINGKGEMLAQINALGQGPGEYEVIYDLLIDSKGQLVEILDGKSGKIIQYDLDGRFIEEWKQEAFHMARSFGKLSDDVYAVYGGVSFEGKSGHRLLYVSKAKDRVTHEFFPIGKEAGFAVFLDQNNFWTPGGDTYFSFSFQDTVYRLGEGGPEPRLALDYGNYALPKGTMERDYSDVREFIEYCRQTNAAYQSANYFETGEFLFFTFEYLSDRHQGYYSRKDGEVKIVSGLTGEESRPLEEELYYFLKYPVGVGENKFYFEIEPYDMFIRFDRIKAKLSDTEWEKLVREHKDLIELYQSLDKDDSNILVKARLSI